MGNSIGRRYRYGSSFVDLDSGVRFEGHHPIERPDLWKLYLHEAEGRYRNFGTEDALRRQVLEDGDDVPLFFLGFDADGEAVAGVRCHGPLDGSHQAILMQEMGGSPEINEIACLIDFGLPTERVLQGMRHLDLLREACSSTAASQAVETALQEFAAEL